MQTWFPCGDSRERDHLEDLGVDGEINSTMDFSRTGMWMHGLG